MHVTRGGLLFVFSAKSRQERGRAPCFMLGGRAHVGRSIRRPPTARSTDATFFPSHPTSPPSKYKEEEGKQTAPQPAIGTKIPNWAGMPAAILPTLRRRRAQVP